MDVGYIQLFFLVALTSESEYQDVPGRSQECIGANSKSQDDGDDTHVVDRSRSDLGGEIKRKVISLAKGLQIKLKCVSFFIWE